MPSLSPKIPLPQTPLAFPDVSPDSRPLFPFPKRPHCPPEKIKLESGKPLDANAVETQPTTMARRNTRKNDPNILREHLDGGQILEKVFEIVGWLHSGWIPEYSKPLGPVTSLKPEDFQVVDWILLRPADVSRLRSALDFYLKLLAKIMPDLKSIEVNDISQGDSDRISPQERATRLFQVLNSMPEGKEFLSALRPQDPSRTPPATTGSSGTPPAWH